MSVKNFSNTVDLKKMGIANIKNDIAGLKSDVSDLETTVGGVSSGLVKKVNDLDYAVEHMHGIYHQAYTADASPISVTFTFTEVIGIDTFFDIYFSDLGITPTSFSVSGQTATVVIPAQAADGVITIVITNPEMPI